MAAVACRLERAAVGLGQLASTEALLLSRLQRLAEEPPSLQRRDATPGSAISSIRTAGRRRCSSAASCRWRSTGQPFLAAMRESVVRQARLGLPGHHAQRLASRSPGHLPGRARSRLRASALSRAAAWLTPARPAGSRGDEDIRGFASADSVCTPTPAEPALAASPRTLPGEGLDHGLRAARRSPPIPPPRSPLLGRHQLGQLALGRSGCRSSSASAVFVCPDTTRSASRSLSPRALCRERARSRPSTPPARPRRFGRLHCRRAGRRHAAAWAPPARPACSRRGQRFARLGQARFLPEASSAMPRASVRLLGRGQERIPLAREQRQLVVKRRARFERRRAVDRSSAGLDSDCVPQLGFHRSCARSRRQSTGKRRRPPPRRAGRRTASRARARALGRGARARQRPIEPPRPVPPVIGIPADTECCRDRHQGECRRPLLLAAFPLTQMRLEFGNPVRHATPSKPASAPAVKFPQELDEPIRVLIGRRTRPRELAPLVLEDPQSVDPLVALDHLPIGKDRDPRR